jgi:hypothetical protein
LYKEKNICEATRVFLIIIKRKKYMTYSFSTVPKKSVECKSQTPQHRTWFGKNFQIFFDSRITNLNKLKKSKKTSSRSPSAQRLEF